MSESSPRVTHKSPRKEAPNATLVNFFKKSPTKSANVEMAEEESKTVELIIPEPPEEEISKSAVVPDVEMTMEPDTPAVAD